MACPIHTIKWEFLINLFHEFLVTELLPHLYKYTVCFSGRESDASVDTVEGKSVITMPYDEYAKFLRLGQAYYIHLRDWKSLSDFSTRMIQCCG